MRTRYVLVFLALASLALVPFLAWDDPFRDLPRGPALTLLKQRFGHGVSPSDGRHLYDLIHEIKATRALEIGTNRGYSTLWIATALQKTGGRVTTLEIDPATAGIAQSNFNASGLAPSIDLRVNDALLEIPKLAGPFDFVFIDLGLPLNRRLLALFLHKLAPSAVIVCHNGAFLYLNQREYLAALAATPRVTSTLIPTLSGGLYVSTLSPGN